jgi:hypothetical protein
VIALVACVPGVFPPALTPTVLPTPVPTATLLPNVPALRLVGPTGSVQPGESFDVQVRVDCPVANRGAQFGLSFDPALLEATGVDEGDDYGSWGQANGATTTFVSGVQIDAQHGWVRTLATALLGEPGRSEPVGPGLLATAHFRAKVGASGNATITLENVVISQLRPNGGLGSTPTVQLVDVTIPIGASAPATQPAHRLMSPAPPGPGAPGGA